MDIEMYNKRLAQDKLAYKAHKAKLRKFYHYARGKGFSSVEARLLSFGTKEFIDDLARSRAK